MNSQLVKAAIYEQTGCSIEKLQDNALVESELGITGDDALELLEVLHEKFKTDFSNMDVSLHFAPEAGPVSNKEYGYYPVSVEHLVQVVEKGEWELPPRNEEHFKFTKSSTRRSRAIRIAFFLVILVGVLVWEGANA